LIRYAYEWGCTHFDTAEGYGAGDNERLLGEAIKPIRNKVVIATKFNLATNEAGSQEKITHSIKRHLEASFKNLRTDHVELYYQHRINKSVPVEDVAYVMGALIKEGKILGWGQSQATEDEIRRAHAVTPLTAVQSEYSIMDRMFEKDVIPICEELKIGFVPFSPLASGFLSGKYKADTQYTGDDVRRVITRFDKENIHANQPLLDLLHTFAAQKTLHPHRFPLHGCCIKKRLFPPYPVQETRIGSKKT
jgi:aryl-alcohol dehydrogenase-like predicted oxidoreductase